MAVFVPMHSVGKIFSTLNPFQKHEIKLGFVVKARIILLKKGDVMDFLCNV